MAVGYSLFRVTDSEFTRNELLIYFDFVAASIKFSWLLERELSLTSKAQMIVSISFASRMETNWAMSE